MKKVKNIRLFIADQHVDQQLSVTLPSSDCQLSDFHPVTSEKLLKIVQRSTNKSCQLDPIPTSVLKRHIMTFLPKLTEIVYASLQSGVFPKSLGDAIVTPILKKPSMDKEELKNYRPVSNIRYLSKVIETVVCSQLTQYLDDHKLLDPLQSHTELVTAPRQLFSGGTQRHPPHNGRQQSSFLSNARPLCCF